MKFQSADENLYINEQKPLLYQQGLRFHKIYESWCHFTHTISFGEEFFPFDFCLERNNNFMSSCNQEKSNSKACAFVIFLSEIP